MVCPIWGTPAIEKPADDRDGQMLDSPRVGGDYFVARTAIPVLANCDERVKVRLTSWLMEQRRLGNSCPEVTTTTISDAKLRPDMSIDERIDSILLYIESKSDYLGATILYSSIFGLYHAVNIVEQDRVYCDLLSHSECIGGNELMYLLAYLEQQGLIVNSHRNDQIKGCALTVDGYARVDKLKDVQSISTRAFVAMWFDGTMTEALELGFKPAIREAGYKPIRIDQMEHIDKIDDKIISEIRKSRFIVADFTHGRKGARGGVYYEAGFARGLNIPVISTCLKKAIGKVHFDTRQYSHILWEEPDDLRQKLLNRIEAVIGRGPIRVE